MVFEYTLSLADTPLILGHRNSEWCGHGPVLEQDIALTNIALDLLGTARNFYVYAASVFNKMEYSEAEEPLLPALWKTFGRPLNEDDLAYLRDPHQFRNLLMAELPRGDWAHTVLRQFFLSNLQNEWYAALQKGPDPQLAAIAEKASKEIAYHLRWSSEWVIRLGDGTEESHRRMETALAGLAPFTEEFFEPAPYESAAFAPAPSGLRAGWLARMEAVFSEAGLSFPPETGSKETGGKSGRHRPHLEELLSEMQALQRSHPDAAW